MRTTSRARFQRIVSALAQCSDRELERKALPYFRLIDDSITQPPPKGTLDQGGIDLASGTTPHFNFVVQCKGILLRKGESPSNAIHRCLKSIETFKNSGFTTERYVLFHTAYSVDLQEFISKVQAALEELKSANVAKRAELWSVNDLLDELADIARARLIKEIEKRTKKNHFTNQTELLAEVPYDLSNFAYYSAGVFDSKKATGPKKVHHHGDPKTELETGKRIHASLILGEYGMGKTTLALRIALSNFAKVVYFPAAALPFQVRERKEILGRIMGIDALVNEKQGEEAEALESMLEFVSDYMLSQNDNPHKIALLIDGLDEAPLLTRPDGLPLIMGVVGKLRVPVILTMRTEFWQQRKEDFSASLNGRLQPTSKSIHTRNLRLLTLTHWHDDDILKLTQRWIALQSAASAKSNLEKFSLLVRSGKYTDLYGDIPRTPFLLKLVLERVVEVGPEVTGRATLVRHAIASKLRRDLLSANPDGVRRSGIVNESELMSQTMELAMIAMKEAAKLMMRFTDGKIALLPTCSLAELREAHPYLRYIKDATGLFINSLLMPMPRNDVFDTDERVRFSHYAFQEFICASVILEQSISYTELPHAVEEWKSAILRERGQS